MTLTDYPKEWQFKIIAGELNSYRHIRMTDCKVIFDSHMKSQDRIIKNLELIEDANDLFNLYLELDSRGVWNMRKLFWKTFKRIKKRYQEEVHLNIWDYKSVIKLYKYYGNYKN